MIRRGIDSMSENEFTAIADANRLTKWAEQLLDIGKRNQLVSYKDLRAATAEIVLPDVDTLFEKASGSVTLEVYDPKIAETDTDEDIAGDGTVADDETDADIADTKVETSAVTAESAAIIPVSSETAATTTTGSEPAIGTKSAPTATVIRRVTPATDTKAVGNSNDAKAGYIAEHARRLYRQNQILLYNASSNPMVVIRNIKKKAWEAIEESGVNVSYLAFGFIHYKESENAVHTLAAPLLLVPIEFMQASLLDPMYIKPTGDDIVVNPTFAYMMEAEYGEHLPEYNDEGLRPYLENVQRRVAKLHWTVTAECKIGNFSFQKINMYRDLMDNKDAILENENVRTLLGMSTERDYSMDGTEHEEWHVEDPLIDLSCVVDADSSQIEAIELAKSGRSYVLQGPPGTGKSQTITNIIAECLSDGKKVLFVSEKMAALNVVYDKLKKTGLDEFCLELHSHKTNKKAVIDDICHALHMPAITVSSKADSEIEYKRQAQNQLDDYERELHQKRPVIEASMYALYEHYAALRDVQDVEWIVPDLPSKGEAWLADAIRLLRQYEAYIPSISYDYRRNAWYGYINQDTSYQARMEVRQDLVDVVEPMHELIPLMQEFATRYSVRCDSIEDARTWQSFCAVAATSRVITPGLLARVHYDEVNNALEDLQLQSEDIVHLRSMLGALYDDDIYRLNGAEYHKKLTRQFTGTFSRLLNAEYKQIINDLRLCRKDGRKVAYSEACTITERLADYQRRVEEYKSAEEPAAAWLGDAYKGVDTDWDLVAGQLNMVGAMFGRGYSYGTMADASDLDAMRGALADYAQRFEAALASCEQGTLQRLAGYYDPQIFDVNAAGASVVQSRVKECIAHYDGLETWCQFRRLLSDLQEKGILTYVHKAIQSNVEDRHITDAFCKLFYYQWIDSIRVQSPALGWFNQAAHDQAVKTFVEKDKEQFDINKSRIRATLSQQRPSTDMAAAGSALSILLREEQKKRRQTPIRKLLVETGELVQKIKPCFMMSPLSVSTFLAQGAVHFDVVIFDEASQIFPQDAIGAIYRADQLIVVGDAQQMPPTNFFSATIGQDETDSDDDKEDVTDYESILDLCAASLPQRRLRWHYRSRYEQLIAFSNKNYYDNTLITFPSAKADAKGIGVDYYPVGGIYDRRAHVNRTEAERVVDLIYENIDRYPERSLGVVAFNIKQQDLIERLLIKRRQATPDKEYFFHSDSKEPFFIKNLETVQGDERDTIIFSTAYGKDQKGVLSHNFGPLNRTGGERRLNVAVTRAKRNVQLVSSMHASDIDLTRTASEGARLLREYLDYAEHGAVALERDISVSAYDQFDSDFEMEVCDFLRSRGFSVDTQVGCSGFRIDLGIKRPDSSDYVLAVECDGATYHSSMNARDRDRLRQAILEDMGWKFYRIWSTDWFRHKDDAKMRLLEAAVKATQNPSPANTVQTEEPASTKSFEEIVEEKHTEFPTYVAADINAIARRYSSYDFAAMVRAIMDVEAPLSEEFLLRRVLWYFDRDKITSTVRKDYAYLMRGCQRYGIIRRNGFLYLDDADLSQIQLRVPGDEKRDIKQIAPEELAAGMYEILKQNVTIDKANLYRALATQCGFSRVGRAITETLDNALLYLDGNVEIDGDQVSLK